MTQTTLVVDRLTVNVHRKRMKNLRLAVLPPAGSIRLSAPFYASKGELIAFVKQNTAWIISQQESIQAHHQQKCAQWQHDSTVSLFGQSWRLNVDYSDHVKRQRLLAEVEESGRTFNIVLPNGIAKGSPQSREHIEHLVEQWSRSELKKMLPSLINKWQPRLNVEVNDWGIRKMRTRWGTCNIQDKRIWLSLALAKYPLECLEYVVVHEMVHLLEKNHTPRFWHLVDTHFPQWRESEALLKA